MKEFGIFLAIVCGIFLLAGFIRCIRIVPQAQNWITEFLGKYKSTWGPGLHVKLPFVEKVVSKVSMKEQTLDFPPQGVITKDNVSMRIDSVVFMQVSDARLYTYGVDNPRLGVENLTATTLRNIIGTMEFDESLSSRDQINNQMQSVLDDATDPWGIKIRRVEVKSIEPPADIREIMTKQMTAERERRQTLLEAEAHQTAVIKRAEGDKQAKVLMAEAERDARIARAEGEAESIKKIYEAEANAIKSLKAAAVTPEVLQLRGLYALKDIADGNATKIFMPSGITELVTMAGVLGEGMNANAAVKDKSKPSRSDDCCDDDHLSDTTREIVEQNRRRQEAAAQQAQAPKAPNSEANMQRK